MSKTSALLAALIAVSGAAFAADTTATQSGDTLGAKTRRGAHDVGSAFRQMGRDAKGVAQDLTHRRQPPPAAGAYGSTGYGGDTRADMSGDSARRQRMDAAYANWQTKR